MPLSNISKLWTMYKPSKELQPILISTIITGYIFYKIEFGGEKAAERRKKSRSGHHHH